MKNKLFAKKYYFCMVKMAEDESLKSKDKKIVNCQFSTLNFQFSICPYSSTDRTKVS